MPFCLAVLNWGRKLNYLISTKLVCSADIAFVAWIQTHALFAAWGPVDSHESVVGTTDAASAQEHIMSLNQQSNGWVNMADMVREQNSKSKRSEILWGLYILNICIYIYYLCIYYMYIYIHINIKLLVSSWALASPQRPLRLEHVERQLKGIGDCASAQAKKAV